MNVKRQSLHLIAPTTGPHVYEYIESVTIAPITLLTLAALVPDYYDITIMDENVDELVPGPCDLAAISVICYTAAKAYKLAEWYRRENIPVIMGGGHATLCPDEVREHCDCIVIGEADDLWPEILADFESGELKPEYREREKPDLSRLPPPRYDLIDKTRYNVQNIVQTSRGCSFGCDFCAIPPLNGRRSRHKRIEQVIDEIKESLKSSRGPGRRTLFFSDDNIVNDVNYAKELFRALIPLKILWGSQCSLSIAYDEELLALARKSGCNGLFIGFETANQRGLDEVHKRYDAAKYSHYIERIRGEGITILGSFLFGLDHDTASTFKDTVDFCMANGIDFVNFHIVSPTPGIPFFDRLKAENRLLHYDWRHYQENATFKPRRMSMRELQDGQIWAYRDYFRPLNIMRRVFRYWNSPLRFLAVLGGNLRFRRKMLKGVAHQTEFLKYYNTEVLGIA